MGSGPEGLKGPKGLSRPPTAGALGLVLAFLAPGVLGGSLGLARGLSSVRPGYVG